MQARMEEENSTAVKRLQEQFESIMADQDERSDPETVQEVQVDYEPRQLFADVPLKKAAAHDSIQDDDSPSGERLTTLADSNDGMLTDFEPFATGYPAVYKEEDSFLASGEQLLNVPGEGTARKVSHRDTDSAVKPTSQDARGKSVRNYIPRAIGEARKQATLRTTNQELTNSELARECQRLQKLVLDMQRSGADSDDLDDRVRTVQDSIGVMRFSRERGYNRQTTVEAVNSLELLKKAMKGVGQKPELDAITAEAVYPWIEACQKVRSLETDVFNDYFPVLISTEAWANIQAWNAVRKEDKDKPGRYWPGKLGHGVIVGRTRFTDSTKATTNRLSQYVSNNKRKMDLNDVHGEGLRGVSWERVCSVLRAMIAPKWKNTPY